MGNISKAYLQAHDIHYAVTPTQPLFENIQVTIEAGDRIALVGRNGIGKSTLLRILAGEISPTRGTILRNGGIYYLPQISTLQYQKHESVFDILSRGCEEWWQVEDILKARFNTQLDISHAIADLSGGELTKLLLAIGLSQNPQVLLLDEPTNHMDYLALTQLHHFLATFEGAFVIVSHKPFFLDQVVQMTWELTPTALHSYGGNFSLYRTQKQVERSAALRVHETARKELKRTQAAALNEQKRAAQSSRNGEQRKGSLPKIVAGMMQRQAEATAGKLKLRHEAAVDQARQKVLDTKLKTTKATRIQLEENSQKRRQLLRIEGATLSVAGQSLIQNIRLHITTGDRIALAGANGSGKSSLAKAVLNLNPEARLESGEIFLAPHLKVVYLDQTYALVQRDQSVLDNLQLANPDLPYQLLRQQLGHFLFFNQEVHKPASVLSGGELARLAVAMLSLSQVDLLILDEPSNNLDIETVDHFVNAINDYQGALWVISHDLDFLSRINITKALKLRDQKLEPTLYLPHETEDYYRELTGML